jgi:chorismate synthase
MATLEYMTAGESHGKALVCIIQGLPAGLELDLERVNGELARRQGGYGRGDRQKIEADRAELLAGVRRGATIGSPLALRIANRDCRIDEAEAMNQPRPGHADLAGAIKLLTGDYRGVLERASARRTAAMVAAGAVAHCLLAEFGIDVVGFVLQIGPQAAEVPDDLSAEELRRRRDASRIYCPDPQTEAAAVKRIDETKAAGDTLGGLFEVRATGVPIGLGGHAEWTQRLNARIAYAVMGINAVKGVEFGLGFRSAETPGSRVHDEIFFDESLRDTPMLGFRRGSNNAGGIEGGISNGQPIVLRAAMKPIPTLVKPLRSIQLDSKEALQAAHERSDVCAVPAASVVGQNVVAFELARAFLAKFGGDSLQEVRTNYRSFLDAARRI